MILDRVNPLVLQCAVDVLQQLVVWPSYELPDLLFF